MITQLHLALVMAIDARLLVLDEPTLGLDILYRKQFYDSLLNDYFDKSQPVHERQVHDAARAKILAACPFQSRIGTITRRECLHSVS
jgi:ABC-type transporter Mla maintaining outer membrane lipid asymmetry ATPase subunit MlaF